MSFWNLERCTRRLRFGTTIFLILSACLASTGLTAQAQASQLSPGGWVWTPGLCKSALHNNGVTTPDGRWFSVQAAYCIGLRSSCLRGGDGVARFSEFLANTHSYNGANRFMHLRVDGHNSKRYYV